MKIGIRCVALALAIGSMVAGFCAPAWSETSVLDAIRKRGLKTAGEVTACLKAGGNCGSCVPEIKSLIAFCAATDEASRKTAELEH